MFKIRRKIMDYAIPILVLTEALAGAGIAHDGAIQGDERTSHMPAIVALKIAGLPFAFTVLMGKVLENTIRDENTSTLNKVSAGFTAVAALVAATAGGVAVAGTLGASTIGLAGAAIAADISAGTISVAVAGFAVMTLTGPKPADPTRERVVNESSRLLTDSDIEGGRVESVASTIPFNHKLSFDGQAPAGPPEVVTPGQ